MSAPAPIPTTYPLPEHNPERSGERSGSGSHPARAGSGSITLEDLPPIPGVQWERNARGGFEAWHVPPGATHRREKTYLGYLGKRLLATATPESLPQTVQTWIRERRQVKKLAE